MTDEGMSVAVDEVLTADQVPPVVAALAAEDGAGARIRLIWRNDIGGRTFRLERSDRTEYVKWATDHPETDLALEAEKLSWAGRFSTVPEVLGHGRDGSEAAWLHTAGIDADCAIAPQWKADPPVAARAIGIGLRRLHDRLPIDRCRWSWRIADRASQIHRPADRELIDRAPPEDHLVVCHGDACAPNTLVAADGSWAGHVDLGQLGVADRWADLAVATYSLDWNYTPACEDELLEAYGIERDQERIDYYRRLWDAS